MYHPIAEHNRPHPLGRLCAVFSNALMVLAFLTAVALVMVHVYLRG